MKPSPNPLPTGSRPPRKPRLWPYALAFLLMVLGWVLTLELWLKPAFLAVPGAAIPRRLGLYLVPPLMVVLTVYCLRVAYVRRKLGEQEEQAIRARMEEDARRRAEEARRAATLERKRFTLDILAVGVAVEYLRRTQVWEELQAGGGQEPVLSSAPEDYPTALEDKEKAHRERESEVLEQVLEWLSDEWPIPTFLAGPTLGNPRMMALLESNLMEALDYGEVVGRRLHVVESLHDGTPDALLQKVFDFLEQQPEVPAVLLVAEDGAALRNGLRGEDSLELLYEGPRPGDALTESVVALVLGRKDRIEPMRALIRGDASGADALKPFWEKEQLSRSTGAFRTSEWLPGAWSEALLEAYAKLPVLGRLHRPQFVHFPGKGEASRAESLRQAWQEALVGLDEGGRHEHLFYDFGPVTQGRRLAPLSRAMVVLAPDFDVFDQGINLHRRLGDTGAASPFLGTALAAMASHREQGVSASVFLRREEGASLVMVSPPREQAVEEPLEAEHELAHV